MTQHLNCFSGCHFGLRGRDGGQYDPERLKVSLACQRQFKRRVVFDEIVDAAERLHNIHGPVEVNHPSGHTMLEQLRGCVSTRIDNLMVELTSMAKIKSPTQIITSGLWFCGL